MTPEQAGALDGALVEVTDGATPAGLAVARVLAASGGRVVLGPGENGDADARSAARQLRAEGLDVHHPDELTERAAVSVSPATEGEDATGRPEVVVVGMGLAVPGASSPEQFWQSLREGEPRFTEPGDRLDLTHLWSADRTAEDRTYTRTAGFMSGFTPHPVLAAELASGAFEPSEHTAVWLRHALLQALDGVTVRPADRQLFAVGLTPDGSQHLEQSLVRHGVARLLERAGVPEPAGLAERYPLGAADPAELLPFRIARMAVAGLPGRREIAVVDTACSSSLYTIDMGVRALRNGDADVAVCGGAFALTAQNLVLFSKLQGLSKTGRVRSLDEGADGVLFSDSAAVLVLKSHPRAVADGDDILGYIGGFGGSSDGRGKAIYAPNPAGQRIALERAWTAAGIGAADLDWIVAHATGTPTGDRTELTALADTAPAGTPWTVTSNKSLIGHSGWAAGVVSAIHALLALRHQSIPAQRQFAALPAGAPGTVQVPTADVSFPARPDRPRRVGISAMGFGGTNGHLVLTDQPSDRPIPEPSADPVVVVGTGWHLPGEPDRAAVGRWLAGDEPSWPAGFGADYPLPSPLEVKLAPTAIAAMDRSQLMALRCLRQLPLDWADDGELAARTGVLVGHTGPTRSALGYGLRCLLADFSEQVLVPAGIDPQVVAGPVRAMVRPTNEDSYPGLMPNIIAARVAQRLDLHGLNMTLDAGRDSVQSALASAIRYLRDGELDVALVLGVNATGAEQLTAAGAEPAEAAIGFVLTRAGLAERLRLPVLGQLAIDPASDDSAANDPAADDGATDNPAGRDHRGVAGAVSLLRALHAAAGTATRLVPVEDRATPTVAVTSRGVLGSEPADRFLELADLSADFQRYQLVLRESVARPVPDPAPALPSGSLVVIDQPAALAGVPLPPDCLLVAPPPAPGVAAVAGVHYLSDPAELTRLLARSAHQPAKALVQQVRVVLSTPDLPAALAVHELAFVAAQAAAASLREWAVLVLGGMRGLQPEPVVGLFGGLARSLARELPAVRCSVTAVETGDPGHGQQLFAAELASRRHLPVAYYVGTEPARRYEARLEPVRAPGRPARLPERPVLVATGGASGLTAHLVRDLATGSRPDSIWLLGSSPHPGAGTDLSDPDRTSSDKAAVIRRLLAERPADKLAGATRRYEQAMRDADRRRVMAELERLAGPGGVHYQQCDVLDEAAVAAAIHAVVARTGRVDVVVHGAGLTRSASLARKSLDDFRAVRDVKVLGYRHLRHALAAAGQHPALWCSVSSVSAVVGMQGEFDYCAGNEYLMLAAAWARTVEGRDEVAMTSGLWLESGMASADTPNGAFLARQAEIGQLTDAQGRQFFAAELAGRPGPEPVDTGRLATTWLSPLDWRSLRAIAPDLAATAGPERAGPDGHEFEGPDGPERPDRLEPPETSERPDGPAFLTQAPVQVGDGFRWRCRIELDRHRYLRDHLVDGRPAVPGTFILELAAEAATALHPGLRLVAISDVVFSRFIRAAEHRWPREVVVEARADGPAVAVRVLSPATALLPETEHSRMRLWLAPAAEPAPRITVGGSGWPAPNAYQLPGTPVALSGVFDAMVEPRFEADGGSAWARLAVSGSDGPFAGFVLPSLLLDCLLRTAVLDGAAAGVVSAMVPTGLAGIRFYDVGLRAGAGLGNDVQLATLAPSGIWLRHVRDARTGVRQCAAVLSDGRVLVVVDGVAGADQARFDVGTGRWLSPTPEPGLVRAGRGAEPGGPLGGR